ncbi:hypothetical protein [Caulobacter segnis]|uniref:hypothetical protein n=1 Tax=Caulobacter segnis TaxID=88688 RepID=UPI001CBBCF80|nr:hypothetical protein [Caulobacter segnis]UAL10946.1 hypothetical protein K8940_01225 [Caulobacter segnis]
MNAEVSSLSKLNPNGPYERMTIEMTERFRAALEAFRRNPESEKHSLEMAFRDLSKGLVQSAYRFDAGATFFRGRIMEQRPSLISEISAPPPSRCKLGRVNQEGESIFYAATARAAVPFEIRIQEGQTFALGHWKLRRKLTAIVVAHHQSIFARNGSQRFPPLSFQGPWSQENAYRIGEQMLAEVFGADSNDENHKCSSFIASIIRTMKLDGGFGYGLLYPTMAMGCNADNVAVKPRLADSHLELEHVEFLRLTKWEGLVGSLETIAVARKFSRGKINWETERGITLGPGEAMKVFVENGMYRFAKELPDGSLGAVCTL